MRCLSLLMFWILGCLGSVIAAYGLIVCGVMKACKDCRGLIDKHPEPYGKNYNVPRSGYSQPRYTSSTTTRRADKPKPRRWETELNYVTTEDVKHDIYMNMKPDRYYTMEIVRPEGRFKNSYYRDDTRLVNGKMRVVSKQRMYVGDIRKGNDKIELECRGYDNRCRRDNRTYTFYQTPDSQNQRDEYILNIEED